jgi:hypothetical protein
VHWIRLAQDRDQWQVLSCKQDNETSDPIKGREFID